MIHSDTEFPDPSLRLCVSAVFTLRRPRLVQAHFPHADPATQFSPWANPDPIPPSPLFPLRSSPPALPGPIELQFPQVNPGIPVHAQLRIPSFLSVSLRLRGFQLPPTLRA